jgi:hypothetical protein
MLLGKTYPRGVLLPCSQTFRLVLEGLNTLAYFVMTPQEKFYNVWPQLDGGQLRHAQVQRVAPVRQRRRDGVHGQPGDRPPQRDGLHQLEPVLHRLQAGRGQPVQRSHLLRQHRPRLGRYFSCKFRRGAL